MSTTNEQVLAESTTYGVRDRILLATLAWIATDPAFRAANSVKTFRKNGAAPLVVIFVVAIAVLLVLAVALTAAAIVFCNRKGMDFEWLIKTSWFTVKVACSS